MPRSSCVSIVASTTALHRLPTDMRWPVLSPTLPMLVTPAQHWRDSRERERSCPADSGCGEIRLTRRLIQPTLVQARAAATELTAPPSLATTVGGNTARV